MICPSCGSPPAPTGWTPYNVSGRLYIACQCRCGTRWNYDRVEMIIPPPGKPPADLPPLAPVDFDTH